jgi:inner membrane protein
MRLLYKTHVVGGFIAGYLLTGNLAFSAVSAVFALLPDIDSPQSYIGRKIPISYAAKKVFGHRQAVHSLIAAIVFSAAGLLLQRWVHWPSWFAVAVFTGYASHLALDTFNPQGVPWLWPWKFRFRVPLVQTGSALERWVVLPVVFVVAICLVGVHTLPSLSYLERSTYLSIHRLI